MPFTPGLVLDDVGKAVPYVARRQPGATPAPQPLAGGMNNCLRAMPCRGCSRVMERAGVRVGDSWPFIGAGWLCSACQEAVVAGDPRAAGAYTLALARRLDERAREMMPGPRASE